MCVEKNVDETRGKLLEIFSIKKINSAIFSGIYTLSSSPLADENNIYLEVIESQLSILRLKIYYSLYFLFI